MPENETADPTRYVISPFSIECGFSVSEKHIADAIVQTNAILNDLPSTLYNVIDYKTASSIIGAIFCDNLAILTGAIVNPIEKGHPDIIPLEGRASTEEQLRNYPCGLEIKTTVGNIEKGANLRAGQRRIERLTGITWQAHHREVRELLGLVWDFYDEGRSFNFPTITAAFYANDLVTDDWCKISGTKGRNTKVTGMRTSGKRKMGAGRVAIIDNEQYLGTYARFLGFNIEPGQASGNS